MTDESVCSVCSRLTGFGDEERFEPPVNLARCPAPGGMECRAVAQAVAPLRRENEVLRSNSDHLSSENASLASQNESMAMRIESLADELAKPEDVRLREVLDAGCFYLDSGGEGVWCKPETRRQLEREGIRIVHGRKPWNIGGRKVLDDGAVVKAKLRARRAPVLAKKTVRPRALRLEAMM